MGVSAPRITVQELIAILYPAPSIPEPYRLYHGGYPYRGSLSCRMDFFWRLRLLFNPAALCRTVCELIRAGPGWRRRNNPAPPKRTSRVFVIDSRALPPGCRVIDRPWTARPDNIEDEF